MIKSLLLAVCLLVGTVSGQNDSTFTVKVDARMELVAIVGEIAGFREYSFAHNKAYADAVSKHFGPHADHPVVAFTRKMRTNYRIGSYDLAAIAVALEQPPTLSRRTPVSEIGFAKMNEEVVDEFLRLLRDFHRESDFDSFFKQQEPFYKILTKECSALYEGIDISWFPAFYGDPAPRNFIVIQALGNAGIGYSSMVSLPGKPAEIYSIVSTPLVDENGNFRIRPGGDVERTVHEFSHSYVNGLVLKYGNGMSVAARPLFEKVKEQMRQSGYGQSVVMVIEYVVRACTMRYMMAHGFDERVIDWSIRQHVASGFIRMPELVKWFDKYEERRDESFPTLDSFMPQVGSFFMKAKVD